MIRLDNLWMHYGHPEHKVEVLRGVDLEIRKGERVAVTGPSGCGKTTILLLLAALERPVSGSIQIDGTDINTLDSDALADWRRDHLGIVFQSFHLIPSLTAVDNVALPLEIANRRDAQDRAQALLEKVGLAARARHYPAELSGGEKQRVAIARAIAHSPSLILADEPTGNLDDHTGGMVSDVLFDLVAETGATFVLVTHDAALTTNCDRRLVLHDGTFEQHIAPGKVSATTESSTAT